MSSALIDTFSSSSNESNSIVLSHVRQIVKFYIWPLLVVFGLTGNCLSILVLTRRRLIRTSTNNYLTILAAFDSCYLILTLLLNFCSHPKFSRLSFTSTLVYFLRPLADFSSNMATWLIVCFTLERTLAVAKPIYAKRTCSVRRSRRVIGSLLILCFFVTLPTFFEQTLVRESDEEKTQSYTNSTRINDKHNQFYRNLHRSYLVLICLVIIWIPLTLLCICNSILIWYVHRSRRFDNQSEPIQFDDSTESFNKFDFPSATTAGSANRTTPSVFYLRRHTRSVIQKRRVTIILIFCLFVALLLWTPQSLSLTYETFFEHYSSMPHDHQVRLLIFNNFANLFLCLNASIDFILYCFLSEKFARTCRQMVCRQCSMSEKKINQRARMASVDRTSLVLGQTPANLHNQQMAANRTNKYYVQLYDFYRNSSGLKTNLKRRTNKQLSTTNAKIDNHIFYQNTLSKGKAKQQCDIVQQSTIPVQIVSEPMIE